MPSNRKPHNNFAGYRAELRNPHSKGHTIILDCKLAEDRGCALVEDYKEEGGRYQVLCNDHSMIVHCTSMPSARMCMKDPTMFCQICRDLAGEGDGEALAEFLRDHPDGSVHPQVITKENA